MSKPISTYGESNGHSVQIVYLPEEKKLDVTIIKLGRGEQIRKTLKTTSSIDISFVPPVIKEPFKRYLETVNLEAKVEGYPPLKYS